MMNRTVSALIAVTFVTAQCLSISAFADNQMGYQLLTADQASVLPHNGGKLGMQVGRADQITSGGLTFDILRVKAVSPSSAGEKAGLKAGDQIIAVDGRVFPSVAAFAAYVGSMSPGRQISVDYMPANGGPQEAQRVSMTLGAGTAMIPEQNKPEAKGLSTGEKIAIGAGAAALFGCYKLGCFSHRAKPSMQAQPAQQ